jgi:tRNA/tmRNA/rRNA uracil-C5-methylase (TrmA/RlmC/RlmD family)
MKPGARLTVRIEAMAFGGEGVARPENFVVFVPFVITGEEVEVEITEVKKHFARARLLQIRSSSPRRVEPACRYFGQCGGCQYQHLEYSEQLQLKQQQVSSLLERVGGFPGGLVEPVIPCPQPYGYRNRIMIRSQWDKFKQGLNIGYLRAENRLVVDIEECRIAEPALNEQIQQVRAHPPPHGGLKVTLRVAPEGWDVPEDSFFQNNFFLLPKLVEVVRADLVRSGSRFLVDAYCGVGFFALELADLVESYVGVEIDQRAIQSARRNAARRGGGNGEFILGATEDLLAGLLERFPPETTTVLLDPPRRGCDSSSLELLRRVDPVQIIVVSCHPATLARDLKRLCAEGVYRLAGVTPLDMFPQTQHVECVADVRRRAHRG